MAGFRTFLAQTLPRSTSQEGYDERGYEAPTPGHSPPAESEEEEIPDVLPGLPTYSSDPMKASNFNRFDIPSLRDPGEMGKYFADYDGVKTVEYIRYQVQQHYGLKAREAPTDLKLAALCLCMDVFGSEENLLEQFCMEPMSRVKVVKLLQTNFPNDAPIAIESPAVQAAKSPAPVPPTPRPTPTAAPEKSKSQKKRERKAAKKAEEAAAAPGSTTPVPPTVGTTATPAESLSQGFTMENIALSIQLALANILGDRTSVNTILNAQSQASTPAPSRPTTPQPEVKSTAQAAPKAATQAKGKARAQPIVPGRVFNPSPNVPSAYRRKAPKGGATSLLIVPTQPVPVTLQLAGADLVSAINDHITSDISSRISAAHWTPMGKLRVTPVLASADRHLILQATRTLWPDHDLVLDHDRPTFGIVISDCPLHTSNRAWSDANIMAAAIQENGIECDVVAPTSRALVKPALRPVTRQGAFLLEFFDKLWQEHFLAHQWIVIDGRRRRVEPMKTPKPVPNQCMNCFKLGHQKRSCPQPQPTCIFCGLLTCNGGSTHKCFDKECTKCVAPNWKCLRCVNCGGEHKATDQACVNRLINCAAHPDKETLAAREEKSKKRKAAIEAAVAPIAPNPAPAPAAGPSILARVATILSAPSPTPVAPAAPTAPAKQPAPKAKRVAIATPTAPAAPAVEAPNPAPGPVTLTKDGRHPQDPHVLDPELHKKVPKKADGQPALMPTQPLPVGWAREWLSHNINTGVKSWRYFSPIDLKREGRVVGPNFLPYPPMFPTPPQGGRPNV